MTGLTELYRHVPYPAKVAAAGLRGAQLSRWRYGHDADDLVERALEADTLAAGTWEDLLAERRGRLLHHAATTVPYYRQQWRRRRRDGDRRPVEDLASWPVLDKAAVKADPWAFVSEPSRRDPLFTEHTSGTTGTPLTLWWSREATRCWYALFEARTRRWHGVSRHDPWAILGGQPIVAPGRQRPPYWVWNPAMSQLYLSSYHLHAESIDDYSRALARHGSTHLVGYPSSLATMARLLGVRAALPELRAVLTNAESLLPAQRQTIEEAFGVPVRDMFGQAEIVAAGSECDHGTLHAWPEVGIVEILDRCGGAVPPGRQGRLVATGLLNPAMPLVRYDSGDRLTAPSRSASCPCGRTLPHFGTVEGRADDVIVTPDGREVGRLDPVFKADLPVAEAQIHQASRERLIVRVVPLPGFDSSAETEITTRLRDRVGKDMTVDIEPVAAIARTANGKFRAVTSDVRDHPAPPADHRLR